MLTGMSTPASPASRACVSRMSSRSGCELISSAVPVSAARVDDPLDVDLGAGPLQDPAAGEMADAVDVRVVDRAEDPLGRAAVERRVERRDDPVELGERVVVHVERAVRADVHLDPAQHPERLERAR